MDIGKAFDQILRVVAYVLLSKEPKEIGWDAVVLKLFQVLIQLVDYASSCFDL